MKHDSVFDIKSNFVEEQLEQQEGADVMTLYSKNIHKVPSKESVWGLKGATQFRLHSPKKFCKLVCNEN